MTGVYDRHGNQLSSNYFEYHSSRVLFTPDTSDHYFIGVRGIGHVSGIYQLNISDTPDSYYPILDAFSLNETVNTTSGDGSLALSFQTRGDLSEIMSVEIYFSTPLVATSDLFDSPYIDFNGQSIRFDYAWEGWSDNINVSLDLLNTNLKGTFQITKIDLRNEAGYGKSYYYEDLSELGFGNEFTVISSGDDFANNIDTIGILTINDFVTGEINTSADEDWFKVSLISGQTYQVDLLGEQTGSGSLADPSLAGIYDSSGNAVNRTSNDDFEGTNSRVLFTPDMSGDYFIAASSEGEASGTYQLNISDAPSKSRALEAFSLSEMVDATTGSGSLALSFQARDDNAGIDYVEIDFNTPFVATLDLFDSTLTDFNGQTIHINGAWEGWSDNINVALDLSNANPQGTLQVSEVTIRDKAGYVTRYSYEDLAELGFSNEFTLITSGDDFADNIDTKGILIINDTVTGEISTGTDVDWFKASLTAGQGYQFDQLGEATDSGSLYDPYLVGIYDSQGNLIIDSHNDAFDGANSRMLFTPDISGDYFIAASGRGSSIGTYQFNISDTPSQPPSLEAFSSSEIVSTIGDSSLELSFQASADQSEIAYIEIHFNKSFAATSDLFDSFDADFNGQTLHISSGWEGWSDSINVSLDLSNSTPQDSFRISGITLRDKAGLVTEYNYADLGELGFSNEFTVTAVPSSLTYADQIQKIYVAYYGRPADIDGLEYWNSRLDEENGNLYDIIGAYGNSEEFTGRYGNLSNSELIDTIYQQMFGREPDAGGKAFYLKKLNAGDITLQTITLNVLDGAQNEDLTIVNNKVASASYFTDNLDQNGFIYRGNNAAETVKTLLDAVGVENDDLEGQINSFFQTNNTLIGSWVIDIVEGADVITFFDDNTFQYSGFNEAEDSSDLEVGSYSWDAPSGDFSFELDIDNDIESGLSTQSLSKITRIANKLSMESSESLSFNKLDHLADSIIGSWYSIDEMGNTQVISFLSNNQFVASHSSQGESNSGSGIETGTYDWISGTEGFIYDVTYDSNGQEGFSHSGISQIQLVGNQLQLVTAEGSELFDLC